MLKSTKLAKSAVSTFKKRDTKKLKPLIASKVGKSRPSRQQKKLRSDANDLMNVIDEYT